MPSTPPLIQTSAGPVPLPCSFRKVNYMAALFESPCDIINELLKNTQCIPALKMGHKHYIAIGFIEYTDSDLGAYNEMILSVPCIPEGEKQSPLLWLNLLSSLKNRKVLQYVPQIYVTSALSRAAGREIWGFPKEILQITAKPNADEYAFELKDESSDLICSIKGKMEYGIALKTPDMLTLTFKNDIPWITPVHVEHECKVYIRPRLQLRLGNSNHTLCNTLEKLNLANARPLLAFHAPTFKAVFEAGAKQMKKG